MGRQHTEFVQSQWFPWTSTAQVDHLVGTTCRLLSVDPDSRSATLLVRFPPGWIRRGQSSPFDEEIYVLDGEISINERIFPVDFHTHLPAGYPRDIAESPAGAVALIFLTAAPSASMATPQYGFDHAAWVGRTDVFSTIWPAIPAEWHYLSAAKTLARMRVLRDQEGVGQTLILGYPPNWASPLTETQIVDAEFYLLAGEVTLSGIGVMQPGAYIWRPAGTALPPMTGRDGAVLLIRSHGGGFATSPGAQTTIELPSAPRCIIPDDLARRIVAGPYAA